MAHELASGAALVPEIGAMYGLRVPAHLASGARWRVADDLWIVLHQPEKRDSARSALGLHTHNETVITRVNNGKYTALVEVE